MAVPVGHFITATATQQLGKNTPEFSACIEVLEDTTPPNNPTNVASTSHVVGVTSAVHTIDMTWTAAIDKGSPPSGLDGYAYVFNTTETPTKCDKTKDLEETATSVSSAVLPDGTYFFHICPVDNAGNWNNTVVVGPFIIQGSATLTLGVKPCPPLNDPKSTAPCTTAEVLVKNDIVTVAVEMEQFKVENNLGYLAWEATLCWDAKLLQLQGDPTFKGIGPQGNVVTGPEGSPGGSTVCQSVGASVGPGEAGAVDKGNLVNFDFICVEANKGIQVTMVTGNVILGSKVVASSQSGKVTIDCRTARMSMRASGGYYTEPEILIDKSGPNPKAGAVHLKAGDKLKVTVSIDDLKTLVDNDQNPVDGGGYTRLLATLGWTPGVIDVQESTAAALVPCTGSNDPPNANINVNNVAGFVSLLCESDKSQLVSDENQGAGDVWTVTFVCRGGNFAERQRDITLSGTQIRDENNRAVNHFVTVNVVTIICIGDDSNLDGDGCDQEAEEFINAISQDLFGIDFMDKNIYDFPDANDSGLITISDVLAYVQNFGKNDPLLAPATNQGVGSVDSQGNPDLSTVHDVSQPNNDQIGADDILRAALLFGVAC